ncbi:ATP-binding protein [Streptomyces hoynatensis]|uniref:ATP-binding protein n=1 Tax=Streptomyces hoynatensis TaxID=1141874 RepID=UPI00187E16D6|nr:ATP-binding protein [Streptomyces hoynatensis]
MSHSPSRRPSHAAPRSSGPLGRSIARVALLFAAGAAPVVGAAGEAAAAGPALAPGLGGLTAPDNALTGDTTQDTVQAAGGVLEQTGGDALRDVSPLLEPAAERIVHPAGRDTVHLLTDAGRTLAESAPTPQELAASAPSLDNPDMAGLTLG